MSTYNNCDSGSNACGNIGNKIIKVDFLSAPVQNFVPTISPNAIPVEFNLEKIGRMLRSAGVIVDFPIEIVILDHLSRLRGRQPAREIIRTHRQGLRNFDFDELQKIASASGPHEWNSNPAYYHALLLEINAKKPR